MRVLIASVVVGLLTSTWVLAQCQKPSGNQKACYQPNNGVGTCKGWYQGDCGTVKIYSINQFPDGVVSDDKLKTHQPQRDCYQYKNCVWDGTLAKCTTPVNFSPFVQGAKIELNGNCAT